MSEEIVAVTRPRVSVANRADGGVVYWIGKLYGFAALVAVIAARHDRAACVYRYFSLTTPATPDLRALRDGRARRHAHVRRRRHAARRVRQGVARDRAVRADAQAARRRRSSPSRITSSSSTAASTSRASSAPPGPTSPPATSRRAARRSRSRSPSSSSAARSRSVAQGARRRSWRAASRRSTRRRRSSRVYLNHIYLGAGAWGVGAAAHRYFQKDLEQLTLAEAALIAGLAKAPTRVLADPPTRSSRIERRNIVLDKMARYGIATAAEVATREGRADHAQPLPGRVPGSHAVLRRVRAPPRRARRTARTRSLARRPPGRDRGRAERGRPPPTTNADYGARHQDKRQGWRGPEWRVDGPARDIFVERQQTALRHRRRSSPGRRYLAVVDKVTRRREPRSSSAIASSTCRCATCGGRRSGRPATPRTIAQIEQRHQALQGPATSSGSRARSARAAATASGTCRTPEQPARGRCRQDEHEWDEKHTDIVQLEQVPHPQARDLHGRSPHRLRRRDGRRPRLRPLASSTARRRRAGSRARPTSRSTTRSALDQGFGFDTVLNDVPIDDRRPGHRRGVDAAQPRRHASTATSRSSTRWCSRRTSRRSICSSGSARRTSRTGRAGSASPRKIFADDALALGASCTKLDEMTRAFTVFARNGSGGRASGQGEELGLRAPRSSIATATPSRTTRSPSIRSWPPATASIGSRRLGGHRSADAGDLAAHRVPDQQAARRTR